MVGVRNKIKQDLVQFFIPFCVVYTSGMLVCAWEFKSGSGGVPIQSTHHFVGLFIVLAGLILNITSAVTLWRNYSSFLMIRENHQLVRHGSYKIIRHPIYLGVVMVTVGIAIFCYSPLGFIIMLILIPLFLNRIRLEEAMLIEVFGEEYRSYQKLSKKIVPFVY